MIVIKIYKNNALYLAGKISVVRWEKCAKQLKLYFPDIEKIRDKITKGEIIDIPYMTLQKDRRIHKKKVKIERRKSK